MLIRNLGKEDVDLADLVERAAARVGGLGIGWSRAENRFRLAPTYRDRWRKRRDGRLVPHAVCWHAHGWFLRALLDLARQRGVRVRVETVLGKIEKPADLLRLVMKGQPEGEVCECPADEGANLYARIVQDMEGAE